MRQFEKTVNLDGTVHRHILLDGGCDFDSLYHIIFTLSYVVKESQHFTFECRLRDVRDSVASLNWQTEEVRTFFECFGKMLNNCKTVALRGLKDFPLMLLDLLMGTLHHSEGRLIVDNDTSFNFHRDFPINLNFRSIGTLELMFHPNNNLTQWTQLLYHIRSNYLVGEIQLHLSNITYRNNDPGNSEEFWTSLGSVLQIPLTKFSLRIGEEKDTVSVERVLYDFLVTMFRRIHSNGIMEQMEIQVPMESLEDMTPVLVDFFQRRWRHQEIQDDSIRCFQLHILSGMPLQFHQQDILEQFLKRAFQYNKNSIGRIVVYANLGNALLVHERFRQIFRQILHVSFDAYKELELVDLCGVVQHQVPTQMLVIVPVLFSISGNNHNGHRQIFDWNHSTTTNTRSRFESLHGYYQMGMERLDQTGFFFHQPCSSTAGLLTEMKCEWETQQHTNQFTRVASASTGTANEETWRREAFLLPLQELVNNEEEGHPPVDVEDEDSNSIAY